LLETPKRFIRQTPAQLKRRLRKCGLSAKSDKGALSECDEMAIAIEDERAVDFAGALAGYNRGRHTVQEHDVLVTTSPTFIEPAARPWDMLRTIIETLLMDGQAVYFYGWLHMAVKSLRAGVFVPGQAMTFVGPRDCGKSLVQKIITPCLGGRMARPFEYMTGGSSFNSDLFGAEHLMVEDEVASTDLRARRTFGNLIKQVTVNDQQRLHAKGKDAIMLKPWWRMSITTNDEEENLMVLPPLDTSLEDKMTILKASPAEIPVRSDDLGDREAFWGRIMQDIPGLLHYVLNEFELSDALKSRRFGCTHYHHPEIMRRLSALAPETRLLRLIDAHGMKGMDRWSGTASELQAMLTAYDSPCSHEARGLLSWSNACGTYLGRLEKKVDRVSYERTATERRWTVISAEVQKNAAKSDEIDWVDE